MNRISIVNEDVFANPEELGYYSELPSLKFGLNKHRYVYVNYYVIINTLC